MSGVMIVGELMARPATLIAVVPLVSQFGGGVPQGAPLPNLLATRVSSTDPVKKLAGKIDRLRERVQVTVRAASYEDQVAILKLVVTNLNGFTGTILGMAGVSVTYAGSGPDFRDDAASLWMGSEDFFVSFPTN
jgi:hypothetical protein